MPPPGPQFQPLGDWFAMKLRWLGAGLGLLILGAVTTYAQQTPPQPHPAASPQQQPAPNPAARLAEIFAKQRGDKLDLSGVAVIDPQLSLLPQIEPNGLLHMAGFFPSVPSQVNFELLFAPVEGQWRVFGVSLSVGRSAPVAPAAPEAAAGKAIVSQKQSAPPKPSVPSK